MIARLRIVTRYWVVSDETRLDRKSHRGRVAKRTASFADIPDTTARFPKDRASCQKSPFPMWEVRKRKLGSCVVVVVAVIAVAKGV